MKLKIIAFTFLIFGFVAIQTSCKKDKVLEPFLSANCPDTVFYQTQIKTIIDLNCSTSGCHDASGAGGLNLQTHIRVSDRASDILKAIRHEGGVSNMPQGAPKLADSLANHFSCWINQGKLDN